MPKKRLKTSIQAYDEDWEFLTEFRDDYDLGSVADALEEIIKFYREKKK